MTTPIYTVYRTTNNINNKIYIGVHKTTNPNDKYLGSGLAIKSSIKKHGKENFTKSILFEYDNSEDAYLKESQLVNNSFIKQSNTYNMCVGGKGCSQHTKSTRLKISQNNFGKIMSIEARIKISKGNKNKPKSISHRKSISKSTKGKLNPNWNGYFYITPHGKFESAYKASTKILSRKTIERWCKNSDKIISKQSTSASKYLQSLNESPIGKTFKEIGFNLN